MQLLLTQELVSAQEQVLRFLSCPIKQTAAVGATVAQSQSMNGVADGYDAVDGYDAEELPCQDSPQMHLPFDWAESKDMWWYDGEESDEHGFLEDLEVAVDVAVGGHGSQHGASDGASAVVLQKCSCCGDKGHKKETCARRNKAVYLQTPRKSASRKGSEQVCSKCGGVGHNSRACKGGSRFKKK